MRILLDSESSKSGLSVVKTNKGIGIGSTVKQVKKAYPHAAYTPNDAWIGNKAGKGTDFYFTKGRVSEIYLSDGTRVG